jgi:hypothetical protein
MAGLLHRNIRVLLQNVLAEGVSIATSHPDWIQRPRSDHQPVLNRGCQISILRFKADHAKHLPMAIRWITYSSDLILRMVTLYLIATVEARSNGQGCIFILHTDGHLRRRTGLRPRSKQSGGAMAGNSRQALKAAIL